MPRTAPRGFITGLAIVAAVGVVVIVASVWAQRWPLDSDRFADAAADVLDDPDVVAAVSSASTEATFDLVLAVADPRQLLPGPLQNLGAGPERWVRDQIAGQIERVVETDPVQDFLVAAVREAHQEVISLWRDDVAGSTVLAIDGSVVRLDLTGVVAAGLDALVGRGWAPGALGDLHESLRGGLDGTRNWLADNVGVDIGEHIGTVVVYEQAEVDEGGLALRTTRWLAGAGAVPLVIWYLLVAGAGVAAVLLAADRRHPIGVFGVALAAAALLVYLYFVRVASDVEALVEDPGLRRAAAHISSELMRPLLFATVAMVLLGVVAGVAARRSIGSSRISKGQETDRSGAILDT